MFRTLGLLSTREGGEGGISRSAPFWTGPWSFAPCQRFWNSLRERFGQDAQGSEGGVGTVGGEWWLTQKLHPKEAPQHLFDVKRVGGSAESREPVQHRKDNSAPPREVSRGVADPRIWIPGGEGCGCASDAGETGDPSLNGNVSRKTHVYALGGSCERRGWPTPVSPGSGVEGPSYAIAGQDTSRPLCLRGAGESSGPGPRPRHFPPRRFETQRANPRGNARA